MTIIIRFINKNDTSESSFETNAASHSEKVFGEVVLLCSPCFVINPTGKLHIHRVVWGLKVEQEPRSFMLQWCRLSLLILDGVASIGFKCSY